MTEKNSWGRWGPDDQRGALNLITPAKVARAAALVRQGNVFPLATPIRRSGPFAGSNVRNRPLHLMRADGGDYDEDSSGDRVGVADDYLILAAHGATHIDALCHVWMGNHMFNGFSPRTVRSSGARRLGIETVGAVVTRGLLADVATLLGEQHLAAGTVVTDEHIEACLSGSGLVAEPGDVLLVRTGWMEVFEKLGPERFEGPRPGIGLAAARWVVEKGIALVGADNSSVEVVPSENGSVVPVHVMLMRDHGIFLLELADLSGLAKAGIHEFMFVAAPLAILGGTAGPVTPVAIV
jgi:kynurenine formamidase